MQQVMIQAQPDTNSPKCCSWCCKPAASDLVCSYFNLDVETTKYKFGDDISYPAVIDQVAPRHRRPLLGTRARTHAADAFEAVMIDEAEIVVEAMAHIILFGRV